MFILSTCPDLSKACTQRLCLRSCGLLKPRPVPVHKLYKINILKTLFSRHHCETILLVAVFIFSLNWKI
jgi:hypothetical protein